MRSPELTGQKMEKKTTKQFQFSKATGNNKSIFFIQIDDDEFIYDKKISNMQNYLSTIYRAKMTRIQTLILQNETGEYNLFINKLNFELLTMLEGLGSYKELFAAIKDMKNIDIALHALRP